MFRSKGIIAFIAISFLMVGCGNDMQPIADPTDAYPDEIVFETESGEMFAAARALPAGVWCSKRRNRGRVKYACGTRKTGLKLGPLVGKIKAALRSRGIRVRGCKKVGPFNLVYCNVR